MEQFWISLKVANEEIYMKDFVRSIFSSIWVALIKSLHGVPEKIIKIRIKKENDKIEAIVNDTGVVLGDYVIKIISNQIDAFLNSLNDIPKDRSKICIEIDTVNK